MKTTLRRVPPAPEVMVRLYMDYKNSGFKGSFKKYLESIGFTDPADDQIGMDDSAVVKTNPSACSTSFYFYSLQAGHRSAARKSLAGGFQ